LPQGVNAGDFSDVMASIPLEINHDELGDIVAESVDIVEPEWCEKSPYSLRPEQTLYHGWQSFAKFIKHSCRYFFMESALRPHDESQHDEMDPVQILNLLGKLSKELDLFTRISSSENIYRVRIVKNDEIVRTASKLGTPPVEKATQANRMSPAGIPMFYGAFDQQTAFQETFAEEDKLEYKAVYGVWNTAHDLTVLNLTRLPYCPSLFDGENNHQRPIIKFLHQFVEDFTKKIHSTDAKIEYIPTQVVTEYFRHAFNLDGGKIDGIMYPSSKTGRPALVLFIDNKDCGQLVDVSKLNLTNVIEQLLEELV
jgi:hypothetical protein